MRRNQTAVQIANSIKTTKLPPAGYYLFVHACALLTVVRHGSSSENAMATTRPTRKSLAQCATAVLSLVCLPCFCGAFSSLVGTRSFTCSSQRQAHNTQKTTIDATFVMFGIESTEQVSELPQQGDSTVVRYTSAVVRWTDVSLGLWPRR